MYDVKLSIGGADKETDAGKVFERRDPVRGDVASRAVAAGARDAERAVEAAAAAFPAWSALAPGPRRAILLDAASRLKAKAPEFAARMTAETGATTPWGMFNTMFAATLLEEAAALTTQIGGEVIPSNHGSTTAMAVRQPAGVVVGMAPWNAPVILGVRALATPLACGNTVVLKASETCPATHRLIVDVLAEAGVPAGAVNFVTHAPEDAQSVAEALIAHPATRRVNFTGSTRVGRIIGELCGRHLKPVVLELGGKAPLVILDDADIGEAVKAAAFGAFMHQGQICMSTERIIVDEAIAGEFVSAFAEKAKSLPAADPRQGDTPLGAVVDLATVERLSRLIADATAKGAKVVAGGGFDGVIFEATVVDGVTPDMALFREESFGPVVGVTRARGVDEAVALANDSEYGLAAAVFGRNSQRALAVARRIESGICHVNSPTVQDEAQMPFGGVKASGFGRFGGKAGVHEFTDLRWISVESGQRHYPF